VVLTERGINLLVTVKHNKCYVQITGCLLDL